MEYYSSHRPVVLYRFGTPIPLGAFREFLIEDVLNSFGEERNQFYLMPATEEEAFKINEKIRKDVTQRLFEKASN
ncbi:MAG: hypothetical protein AABW47_00350 [Nanoarchaeota archaeon]